MRHAIFKWSAIDSSGKKVCGKASVFHADLLKIRLQKQNLCSIKIRRQFSVKPPIIHYKDITYFTRQMAIMLKAGLPIAQAMDVLMRLDGPLQQMISVIKADLEQGKSIAQSLHKFPRQFDALFCNVVKIGEVAGILDEVLLDIAIHREKTQQLKAALWKAISYPLVVLILALVISLGLLIFIVPQFQSLFAQFHAPLPIFTQIIINLSMGLKHHILSFIAFFVALITGCVIARRHSTVCNRYYDKFILNLPVIGKLIEAAIMVRISRTLSLMVGSGMPLTQALQLIEQIMNNQVYKIAMTNCKRLIKEGSSFHQALNQAGHFPILLTQMIQVGEESGNLEVMLDKAADIYQDELDHKVAIFKELLEPIMMTILGIIVGSLVIAMYLPVFNLGAVL